LIGFPAVSWIYLNSGLKWRVNAQEATQKGAMLEEFVLLNKADSSTIRTPDLRGKFHIVASPGSPDALHNLTLLHEQFSVRPDFRILLIGSSVAGDTISAASWVRTSCLEGCERFQELLFAGGYSSAIVDDSLYLRGKYRLEDTDDMRKLTEHMAVVLPIEKRERIQLIRGNK
jgi:hypothetical protein